MLLIALAACPASPSGPKDPHADLDSATDTADTADTAAFDSADTADSVDSPADTDTAPVQDADGDGHDAEAYGGDDCDDADPDVHPGATDVVGNGKDDDCDGLRGPTLWSLECASADFEDFSVPMAPGDVTGDGVEDLAVGAGYAHDNVGVVYLFSGVDLGPDTTSDDAVASFLGVGLDVDARTGGSPSRALGDLDGDGVGELGYGALYEDVGGANTGSFYAWSGGALHGLLASADADVWLYDDDPGAESGFAGAGVGDLDDDGYPDLAVSSPRGGSLWNGQVWLVPGGATFGTAGATDLGTVASGALLGDDYSVLGWDIAPETDLDDDGHPDLVASAYYGTETRRYYGAVAASYGPVRFASYAEAPDASVNGPSEYSGFGMSFDRGDLDGDGFTDLLAGASGVEQAWIVYGSGDRLGWADVPTLDAVGLYQGAGLRGGVAVADLDGDAVDDLALGARDSSNVGHVYLVRGGTRLGPDGTDPSTVALWDAEVADSSGDWAVALRDLPNPGRPLIAVGGLDRVVLLVQED